MKRGGGVGRRLTEKVRFSQDPKDVEAGDADVGGAAWSSSAVLRTARAEGGAVGGARGWRRRRGPWRPP